MAKYREYKSEELTKEILDTIKVGDLIKINEWKIPLQVYGVSENYFVMARRMFEKWRYLVFEKTPTYGCYRCGKDNTVFEAFSYEFDKTEEVAKYLKMLENGTIWVSDRHYTIVYEIWVKEG